MDPKLEDIGLISNQPGQVITFPSGVFNSNSVMFTPDGTLLGSDSIVMGDLGFNFISIPVHIIQDAAVQQQQYVTQSEVVPDNSTTIYIDQSQLAYFTGGQFVITDEGLLTTASVNNESLGKDNLFLRSTTNTDSVKPLELDLSCLGEEVNNLLLEEETNPPAAVDQPSQQDVFSCTEVSWTQDTTATASATNSINKGSSKDVPPPLRKGPFKCEICFKEFARYNELRKHNNIHLDDKPHKCTFCPASYNSSHNLLLHSAIHKVDCLECPECHKKFNRVASLKNHVTLHEREESLFCSECGDEFSNQVQLDKHVKIHDEEWVKPTVRIYQCPNCDKQYSRASVLRQHMKDHIKVKAALSANSYNRAVRKGRPLHSCTVCSKTFQKPSQLIRHNRIHTGEKPFKCDLCMRSFNQKGSLLIHRMSKHKGMRPYQCQFCSAAFSQKGNLRAHVVRLHSIPNNQETVYQCNECSCVFRKLGSLNAHHNRMHPPADPASAEKRSNEINLLKMKSLTNSQSKDTSDKENDCHEDKYQQRLITIANHLENGEINHTLAKQRQVGTFKWHQCSYCGKEFRKPSDLVRHNRIHTQEKPFKCKICNRGFSLRSSLATHLQTHNGHKEYSCKACNHKCSTASELKQHRRSHHTEAYSIAANQPDSRNPLGLNPLSATPSLVILEQGVIQVVMPPPVESETSSDKPHRCTICGQSYRKASNLKIHLRKHTGEKPYTCQHCSRTCVSAGTLREHMRTHRMVKTHRCNECGKCMSTKASLRRHLETHCKVHPYICPYCSQSFKSELACTSHMLSHEQGEEAQPENEVEATEVCLDIPSIEALIVNRTNMVLTTEEPFIISTVQGVAEGGQTLLADASGTITLTNLGQDAITPENIKDIEESLNNQLFCTSDLTLDVVNQAFESCVFPNLTIQREQIELGQELSSESLVSVLPPSDKPDNCIGGAELKDHEKECFGSETQIVTMEELEEDVAAANLPSIEINESEYRCAVCSSDCRCETGPQSCEVCDKTFSTVAQYKAHTKNHEQEKEFTCDLCGSTFTQLFCLARHMAIHDPAHKNVLKIECDLCGQKFRSKGALRRHTTAEHKADGSRARRRRGEVRQLTEEEAQKLANLEATSMSEHVLKASIAERDRISDVKDPDVLKNEPQHPNQCKYCPKSFRKPSDLVRHLRIHTGERPFQCDFCSKCFTVKSTLDCHLKTHSGQKRCVCHVCGYFFATKGSLKVHMRLHTGSRPFRCPVCFQRFRTSGHRKAHLLLHIKDAQPQPPKPVKARTPPDKQPGEKNPSPSPSPPPSTLSGVQQLQCDVCNKTFNKRSFLDRHMRVHTGEKPFECKVCLKSFTQKSSLDTHNKIHTREKIWSCSECNLMFVQKSNLLGHMKRHHPPDPYTIDLSEEKFPVDLEKVVNELFPSMKHGKTALTSDDI